MVAGIIIGTDSCEKKLQRVDTLLHDCDLRFQELRGDTSILSLNIVHQK